MAKKTKKTSKKPSKAMINKLKEIREDRIQRFVKIIEEKHSDLLKDESKSDHKLVKFYKKHKK